MTVVPSTPRATARLQFHKAFTLDDGAQLVPYLAALGISHLYASPILRARTGSMHGYDVADPTLVNPEIGGEAALRRLVAVLREHGLGLILDIVPNHMGTGPDNPWWQHMLLWGEASPYARYFDIDWQTADPFFAGRILLPTLGEQYGEALAGGKLQLSFHGEPAAFVVTYYDTPFPVRLADYGRILEAGGSALPESLGALLGSAAVNAPGLEERIRTEVAVFAATEEGRSAIAAACAVFNGDPALLHGLLEAQNYRLAWWRTANDEINWRRFFDVNELVGLRIEQPEVFEAVHALIFRLYAEGLADGFRIDHVDGLARPGSYCRTLRSRLAELEAQRPKGAPPGPAYVVVEKILAEGELLLGEWQVDGTSGYDFMDQVSAVLHDARGSGGLNAIWNEVSGGPAAFSAYVRDARLQVIGESFTAELRSLAALLLDIARRSLDTRDTSLEAIRRTLNQLLAHFPVYRTYAREWGRSPTDEAVLRKAMDGARPHVRPGEEPVLGLLDAWLGGEAPDSFEDAEERALRCTAITRFQQLTSPVAAKSVEDTAFYRYGRLLSRNEVGADPGLLAIDVEAFHRLCAARSKTFPNELLATATHDHKRGEDARARLAVLSEITEEWGSSVRAWRSLNAELKQSPSSSGAPDAIDELMLYQTLVGAWPLGLAPDDRDGLARFAERIAQWQYKALREAKRHTRWTAQNEPYESACRAFADTLLLGEAGAAFREQLAGLVQRVAPAGCLNGLSQTMLRLTTPGIPDLYQGTEFWDFSLVDPDNRSPVDFSARRAALEHGGDIADLLSDYRTGAVKQAIIARVLAFRREHAALFARGEHEPLRIEGPLAEHAVAFARRCGGETAVAIASRLSAGLVRDLPLIPGDAWRDTEVTLPGGSANAWHDVVSGRSIPAGGAIRLADALAACPVCLLVAT